jgi:hypothetical protein
VSGNGGSVHDMDDGNRDGGVGAIERSDVDHRCAERVNGSARCVIDMRARHSSCAQGINGSDEGSIDMR